MTTSNNDDHFNKLMESRMDHLEKTFQSKMTLMEENNDALQNELAALRQKELQQDQENKQLRDELTKLKVATEDSINNDSSDNDGDDNTDTADIGVMQGSDDALQKELAALKQSKLEHQEENQGQKERLTRMEAVIEDGANNNLNYDSFDDGDSATGNVDIRKIYDDALQKELADLKQRELDHQKENQRLKERLAIMEAEMQNNADNNLNYDPSVNESDNENDINYDSEYSDSKEEEDNKVVENTQKPLLILPNMNDSHADPNYNSSDNKDPRNDIYYD
jgi:hypothetical protein